MHQNQLVYAWLEYCPWCYLYKPRFYVTLCGFVCELTTDSRNITQFRSECNFASESEFWGKSFRSARTWAIWIIFFNEVANRTASVGSSLNPTWTHIHRLPFLSSNMMTHSNHIGWRLDLCVSEERYFLKWLIHLGFMRGLSTKSWTAPVSMRHIKVVITWRFAPIVARLFVVDGRDKCYFIFCFRQRTYFCEWYLTRLPSSSWDDTCHYDLHRLIKQFKRSIWYCRHQWRSPAPFKVRESAQNGLRN